MADSTLVEAVSDVAVAAEEVATHAGNAALHLWSAAVTGASSAVAGEAALVTSIVNGNPTSGGHAIHEHAERLSHELATIAASHLDDATAQAHKAAEAFAGSSSAATRTHHH